jgi:hypothetical protein
MAAAPQPLPYPATPEPRPLVVSDVTRSDAPPFFAHLTEADFASEAALVEAGALYGDDADRELADLEAGRHPLQRPRG